MKKKTTAATDDSYVRVPDFAELLAGVHLPAEVWAVFAQCDAPRRPSEIARRAHLAEDVVLSSLRRLSRRRLVRKHALDWQAYLASQGAPAAPASPQPEPAPVTATAAPAPAPTPLFVPAPAPAPRPIASSELVSFTVINLAASEARHRATRDVLALHIGRPQPASPVLTA